MNNTINNLIEIRPGRKLRIIHHKNSSDKTLFFIHGLGGRAEQFQAQIDYFKKEYNIIAPDLLGHGRSEKPRENANAIYSFAEQSKDLQIIFDRYQTTENFIIGHSYGGAFATYLTSQNMTKINKLILITPVSLGAKIVITNIINLPVFFLELVRPIFTKAFIKMAFDPKTDPNLIEREIAIGRNNPMYVIKALTLSLQKMPEGDISKITQPTLVITVEKDGLVSPNQVYNFYQHLPNVEFKQVNHASHLVIMEQPQEVNELIREFINW